MKVRVASAGTGKTTSLVARFLERVGDGEPLRRIAGVTFTRSAAAELRERVGEGLDAILRDGTYLGGLVTAPKGSEALYLEARRELDGATLTTIHGYMRLGLRLSAPLLGLDPDFTSLAEWEAESIFDEELAGVLLLAGDPDHTLHEAAIQLGPKAHERALDLFGSRSLTENVTAAEGDTQATDLVALYRAAYQRYLARTGASRIAPSEVERRALAMVRTPAAIARLVERTPRVVVDEYQDVNPLQGRFFEALQQGGIQVEVVGDPKQSIYGFRHADVNVFRSALAAGEVLDPLTDTRRHATLVAHFLNRLTQTLAKENWGFAPEEAPEVTPAGSQREVRGRIEVHWITEAPRLDDARPLEADVLAERLAAAHEQGTPFSDMAVLARNYAGLERVRKTLEAKGIPAVLRQGRGYYERTEIRDLVHALHVGLDAKRDTLAAWLRGPFGGLDPAQVDQVLKSDAPLKILEERHPDLHARLARTQEAVLERPLEALRILLRERLISGKRFIDLLERRQRENVDALLFEVAERPPGELDVLLQRLNLLAERAKEAGDVPSEGEGVTLITIHGAKGLEWPLVALFDVGAGRKPNSDAVHIHDDRVHVRNGPGFQEARKAIRNREDGESFRLLYVAASRARDTLILTGSVTKRGVNGWAKAIDAMGLGPKAESREREDFLLQRHPFASGEVNQDASSTPRHANEPHALAQASWTLQSFPDSSLPPVESPSRIRGKGEEDFEPSEPIAYGVRSEESEGRLPGQAIAVGTLLHDAIRRDAQPDDTREIELLRAQEVMFPYAPEEQDRFLEEVQAMLATYHQLLGNTLPALEARTTDLREWPVALPDGRQVWQGVIDRLYQADGTWYLDDYKTDRDMHPERYAFQLAVYRQAVRLVLGTEPVARLVNLRDGSIYVLPETILEQAWAARTKGL